LTEWTIGGPLDCMEFSKICRSRYSKEREDRRSVVIGPDVNLVASHLFGCVTANEFRRSIRSIR
jgi:hypothetical protein